MRRPGGADLLGRPDGSPDADQAQTCLSPAAAVLARPAVALVQANAHRDEAGEDRQRGPRAERGMPRVRPTTQPLTAASGATTNRGDLGAIAAVAVVL